MTRPKGSPATGRAEAGTGQPTSGTARAPQVSRMPTPLAVRTAIPGGAPEGPPAPSAHTAGPAPGAQLPGGPVGWRLGAGAARAEAGRAPAEDEAAAGLRGPAGGSGGCITLQDV